MDKKSFLIYAITEFEEKAFEVINSMCSFYDLDINDNHPFYKLQSRQTDLWKGVFNHWQYKFHGDACEFINTESKQFLDIKINRQGDFGAINLFFLFKFIESTDNLNEQNLFSNTQEQIEIFEILKQEGIVINVGDSLMPTWILNKK